MNRETVITADTGARITPGVQTIRIGDLPDVAPGYNADIFGDFLRDMKGTKSSREFAIETDLSESFVSKAVNGMQKSRPSKRTLLKLLRAKTEEPVDRRELARVAGYKDLELDAEPIDRPTEMRPLSAAAKIIRYYGEDHFTAMGELQKALSEHGLKGDVSSYLHREAGYFEVTDKATGQVYVGINAYVKPVRLSGDEERTQTEIEDSAVFAIAFSVGPIFNQITMSEDAKDKIVYILTDNERVYEACRSVLPRNKTKATVVVMTEDHQGFCKEDVINGSEQRPISLVD